MADNSNVGNYNDVLMKKSSSNKNPLVTQKKWEHENKNMPSIEQESDGNDSHVYGNKNQLNIPKAGSRHQAPQAPLESDKQ